MRMCTAFPKEMMLRAKTKRMGCLGEELEKGILDGRSSMYKVVC
jgi:hypothetical protein